MANLPVERKEVDPNKWSLNQQTGEYHKVTFTSKDGRRLIEPKTYQDRSAEQLRLLEEAAGYMRSSVIYFVIGGGLLLYFGPNGFNLWFVGLFAVIGLSRVAIAVDCRLKAARIELGPEPVDMRRNDSRDMEDFKNQKAYGAARTATPQEVHDALSKKSGPAAPRRFKD
jgi:hypothetical protein